MAEASDSVDGYVVVSLNRLVCFRPTVYVGVVDSTPLLSIPSVFCAPVVIVVVIVAAPRDHLKVTVERRLAIEPYQHNCAFQHTYSSSEVA